MKNTQLVAFTRFDRPFDPGIDCSKDLTLTQQHFESECNINNIVQKYTQDDIIQSALLAQLIYSDFDSQDDYASMLQRVKDAEENFNQLPVSIRNRFENDPGKLIKFVEDPRNRAEGEKLGIFKPSQSVTRQGGHESGTSPLDVTVLTDTNQSENNKQKENK